MMQDALEIEIETFRARHGMSMSEFSLRAVNSSGLLAAVVNGRKLRPTTMARIKQWMATYEEDQRKADLAALALVKRCGFVAVESDGQPRLESEAQISDVAFRRLVADGQLIPSGDALFGCASQTYRPA
jgi:hypothetical protein